MATIASDPLSRHRELSEIEPRMIRAELRKAESRDFRVETGACLQRAASLLGWSLKELAAKLGRDERQIARWLKGQERVQNDVVLACEELRQPYALQMARAAGARIRIHCEFDDVA